MEIEKLLDKPKIIAVVGNSNSGKSNFLMYLKEEAEKKFKFNLFIYGLPLEVGIKIHSVEELEEIRDSVIILDEFYNLFDLEDTKKRKIIERTLRLIHHNNNILILTGLPNNFKKFIAGLISEIFYFKCNLDDFINGSKLKKVCFSYKGNEIGSSILNLKQNETIYYNSLHYFKLEIPYYKKYDMKRKNINILQQKNPKKNPQKYSKNMQEKIIKKSNNGVKLNDEKFEPYQTLDEIQASK